MLRPPFSLSFLFPQPLRDRRCDSETSLHVRLACRVVLQYQILQITHLCPGHNWASTETMHAQIQFFRDFPVISNKRLMFNNFIRNCNLAAEEAPRQPCVCHETAWRPILSAAEAADDTRPGHLLSRLAQLIAQRETKTCYPHFPQ